MKKLLFLLTVALTFAPAYQADAQMLPQPQQTIQQAGGGSYDLNWFGINDRTYFVQWSTDLTEWSYMPVIESGAGNIIGYGFDGDGLDKMFIRLHYTDRPTSNPNSDDFDNDGISNWDEVREGGTGTNPFLEDTNSDGIRDDGLVYAAQNDPDGTGLSAGIQNGLIGRWDFELLDFDPATGLRFTDQSGNGNHASPLAGSGLEPADAIISKSCNIPGTGYLSIPATVMNGVKEFNLSMWIKPTEGSLSGVNSTKNRVIWSYADTQTALPLLFLSIQNETSVRLRRYNGGVVEDVATWTAPDKLDDGHWRHICFTRETGGSTGTLHKLYINGVQIGAAWGGLNYTFGNNPNGYFLLGRLAAGNTVTQFDGLIDRLLLHNRGLSQVEAQELYKYDADGDGLFDWYEALYNKERTAWQDDPNGDPDRDDLGNLAEQAAGADMRDADTDNDLLPDGYEVTYGLLPTDATGVNGALGDLDGDTLVNLDEFIHASAPDNVDTDGDGANDNVEVANSGLPNDDSDNGEPADPTDMISLQLSIGDPSDSESERYALLGRDLTTGKAVVAHVSPNFGDINTVVYNKFRRGHSYSFSVKHLDTEDGETVDYDYFSEVKFVVPADASKYVWFDPFEPNQKEIIMPPNGQKVLMDAREAGNGDPVGTGGGGSQDFIETIEPLEALLVSVDLDIDSNNNEGFVYDSGSKGEDGIEEATGLPGKVIPLNINDSDGVIDWADGFNINSSDTYDDSLVGVDFVPFLLAFPGSNLNPEDVEVVFHYDASDPAAVTYQTRSYTVSGMSDYDYQLPAEGTLRIWTKNADEPRKKESLVDTPKGDFIPKDTKIKWSDLAETGAQNVKLYLEGVQGEGLKSITVDIYYKGQLLIAEADKINVTLMKAEMVPDYNRDGKIDTTDRDKITALNPWRWWINDDNDFVTEERGKNDRDIPKQTFGDEDCYNAWVDGMRDLIDFFPLHLDLEQALEVLPSSEYKYLLRHEDEALKFYEFPACIIDGSDAGTAPNRYIKSVSVARGSYQRSLSIVSNQGVELSSVMLQRAGEGKGVILVEGAKKTQKPLILEIIHRTQGGLAARIEYPLNIADVEDMYRHVNMRDYTGGSGGNTTQTGEPAAYPDRLTNGKYLAYIHGFIVTGEGARGSQSNLFKRFHQMGSKARFIGLSWHGDPPNPGVNALLPPDYHRAVYNGLVTGGVTPIRLGFTQNSSLTIVAHSLGNSVIGSAIVNYGLDVDHYFIVNGAIPLQAYDVNQTNNSSNDPDMKRYMTEDDWKPYYDYGNGAQQRLFAANWHQLFDPLTDNRGKLTWKDYFAKPELLSVAYNFYSPSDEVVENADGTEEFGDWNNLGDAITQGRHAWVQQEIAKGGQNAITDAAFHDRNGGWQFNGYWNITETSGNVRRRTAAEAVTITDEQLKTHPFHKHFLYNNLYDPNQGSVTAGIASNLYRLLGTGIPATSYAIAANEMGRFNDFGVRNFNMPSELKSAGGQSSWPTSSKQNNPEDWLHSDFKDVAIQFLHPMYQKMIDIADLDEN